MHQRLIQPVLMCSLTHLSAAIFLVISNAGPAIVPSRLECIYFITALRAVFRYPDAAIRRVFGYALGVSVAA